MKRRHTSGSVALVLGTLLLVACSESTGNGSARGIPSPNLPTATSTATKPPVTLSTQLCQTVSQSEASQAANGPVSRVLDVQDQDEELSLDRVTCTYADYSNPQRPVARMITLFVVADQDSSGAFAKSKQSASE